MEEKDEKVLQTPEGESSPALPAWKERLRKRHADRSFETDEDWDNIAEESFAADEQKISEFENNQKVIDELITADKDLSAILTKMIIDKVPFRIAVDGYLEAPKEGDDDYDYYQKSHEERLSIGRQLQEEARQRLANEAQTYKNIDAYCEEKGYDEDAKSELISFINTFYQSLSMKDITPKTLTILDNARTYDEDVKAAHEDGLIEGRNENIEAKMTKGDDKGDGIPRFSGGGETFEEETPKKKSFFGDLRPSMKL